jgi:hypothetical protein
MRRLRAEKLHVHYSGGATADAPLHGRKYTLTHSDLSGDLFLTVGMEFDQMTIGGWYTRFMRDEVLAEWTDADGGPKLHLYCHVSGGFVVGSAAWRNAILQRELPLVLEAFRYGDRLLFEAHPGLDTSTILVHFQSNRAKYHRVEDWGRPEDYRPLR